MENTTYPTPWRVAKNMDIYQVWRQIRALHPGEPMNSAVREYYPDAEFATRRGTSVSAASLGKYVRTGSAIPSTVIVALREAYSWTAEEVGMLLMNGPAPTRRSPEPSRADNALQMIALALKPYLNKEDEA